VEQEDNTKVELENECEISGSRGSEYEVQSSGIYCRVVKSMSTARSIILSLLESNDSIIERVRLIEME
jgi:hypothetical protein